MYRREEWGELGFNFQSYFAVDLIKDTLDTEAISREINDLKSRIQIIDGFCQNCQSFINILPNSLSEDQSEKSRDKYIAGVLLKHPHFQCVAEFEASYQRGCRLCVLLERCHRRNSWSIMSIESFYKIEARKKCLGKPIAIYMMVVRRFSRLFLFLNIPGEEIEWEFSTLKALDVIPVDILGTCSNFYSFLSHHRF